MDQLEEASSRQLDLGLTWHKSFVELGPSSYTPVDAKLRDYSAVQDLLARVQAPFDEHPGHDEKAGFPPDWASHIEISCSS